MVIALLVELGARVGFHRASKIQHRFVTEYQQAQAIATDRETKHVLLVGNSLLLEGVVFDRLAEALATQHWDARRLVLERTFYHDWYYGLKQLLASGARPDVVVVMLTAKQWIEHDSRGDFSAHYLVNAADVLPLSRELSAHPTKTTNLLLAHYSRFWASRAELRNFWVKFLVPDMNRLVDLFTSTLEAERRPLAVEDVVPLARVRVARLRDLLDGYGARLVILVPPTLVRTGQGEGWLGLMRAAETLGVPALKPFDSATFGPGVFRDSGFHLNTEGATLYTKLLAHDLERVLATITARHMHAAGDSSVADRRP